MVSFRRWILALTVLALFAGLASAQVGGQNQLTCATNVSVTPTLRAEGYTEQTGDITLTCTGGATQAPGSLLPQVNIAVFLNTAVTSRLLPQTNVSNNISEALLLIDEPGSGLTSPAPAPYGPAAPQRLCSTPLTGCIEYASLVSGGTISPITVATDNPTAITTQGANVFQGVVSGNSVTFYGIPVLAPVTAGVSRVFRITNIRANATSLSGGSAAGATPVIASISISGATSLLISNPTPTIGFVQAGLSASASGATNANQCSSTNRASINTLTFTENFGTAFKTRVAALSNTNFAGQIQQNQNIPGTIYNSESNFVNTGITGSNGASAGLADFGTRLKAVFNNVPSGVRLFVSTVNVQNNALPVTVAVPGGSAANVAGGGGPYAVLVNGETTTDATGGTNIAFFPSVNNTDVPSTGNTPIVEIPVVNGTAQAVWEVINTNPNAIEALKFGVYQTFSANVAQNSPPPGTATVTMSFAPTPTAAFSASSAAAASSSLPIPRFTAGTGTSNILNINICRTVLLYPYVTNIQGFDTGLAIANTSTDPFGTGAQAGSCDLNWYQGANNPAQGNSGTIASGTIYATLASTAVPGFNGYMIAVCRFQYAHGFAFVSDLGAQKLAMGYLAVVIVDPGTGSRNAQPGGCIGVSGCNSGGEQGGH